MTTILNFALKIKGGGREGGICKVLRPCHPPNLKRTPGWGQIFGANPRGYAGGGHGKN